MATNYQKIGIGALSVASLLCGGLFFNRSKGGSITDSFSKSGYINDHGLSNYQAVDHKKFKLINVCVFARHGARTPNYYVQMKHGSPNWEGRNGYQEYLPELDFSVVLKLMPENKIIPESYVDETYMSINKDVPFWGQLTVLGQEQSISFGKSLKKIYNKFLNPDFAESEIIYRSTLFPRTYYTLKGIISGMYDDELDNCHKPTIYTYPSNLDTFYPNPDACSAIKAFIPAGAAEIAKDTEVKTMKCILTDILGVESLTYLDRATIASMSFSIDDDENDPCIEYKRKPDGKKVVKENNEKKAVSANKEICGSIKKDVNCDVTIYSVRDDVISRKVHNFPYPKEMESYFKEIDRLSLKEIMYEITGNSKEWSDKIVFLVSPVFNYVRTHMDVAIKNNVSKSAENCIRNIGDSLNKSAVRTKMQINSVHDTTIIPMIMALRIVDKPRWPQFMSNLIFELYQERSTSNYYIRVLYNGVEQRLKIDETECIDNEYNKIGLVPYETFKKFLDETTIPDSSYTSACDKAAKLFQSGKPVTKDQFI